VLGLLSSVGVVMVNSSPGGDEYFAGKVIQIKHTPFFFLHFILYK
jgi:hypothetical protein